MKKNDVKVGEVYTMNHTSGRIQVRIIEAIDRSHYKGNTVRHWLAVNLKTGRTIEIKSAVKLS